ncbi:hypothetical protein D1BOALGB6SA_6332 [Olavius sp. associated proteobacterium Delta 1]|nr:hypothetical protein D1BOALGB6SA_6332 [Olavius sp. associated proteobacterium Delta 1]
MSSNPKSEDIIDRMNYILFEREKFRGNRENYYNPDNSFLNRVLDEKTGIPMSCLL